MTWGTRFLLLFANLAVLAVPIHRALAAPLTDGTRLANLCESDDRLDQVVCTAYLRGIYEGANLGYAVPTNKTLFCSDPALSSFDQLRYIFLEYAAKNSKSLSNPPSVAAVLAFREAFGCSRLETPETRRK